MAVEARRRIVIMGAAGRDFHNFNVVYRDDPSVDVVAFTAAQIPGIADRRFPAALAGALYPDGIPILAETDLEALCRREGVHQVVFAYSDVRHEAVMHVASRVLASGADFVLLGPNRTMLTSRLPVIAISATRTGCGKSQVSRWLSRRLRAQGRRVGVIRHPMPYGDLARQAVQRFASRADLALANCTVEEREEYEPHIAAGGVVFAGVDYARILALAEREADLILWEGGNNDFPFIAPDLHVVLADALRPGHETRFHPGEAVLRMADVVVLMKVDSAPPEMVAQLTRSVKDVNPTATVLRGASPVRLDSDADLRGRRVVVVEDGPTVTHGGMPHGAGYLAATRAGAVVVDPRPWLDPALAPDYAKYPHIGPVLPALGYGRAQLGALGRTLEAVAADLVLAATPIDLAALVPCRKPILRVRYDFAEIDSPGLGELVDAFPARPAETARA